MLWCPRGNGTSGGRMCGICGLIGWQGQGPDAASTIRSMLGAIRHRGPDEFGLYADECAHLGHARLSIVDLAGGTQPMFNEDGHLAGMVRRRDIMRGLLPRFLTQPESHAKNLFQGRDAIDLDLADLFQDHENKLLTRNAQIPVTRVMQPIDVAIDADAGLLDLLKEMIPNEAHIIPVMEDDHVIGVVRTVELLNQVRRMLDL